MEDGIDYVPTNKFVLFGHHYASIAGLSPTERRAVACPFLPFPYSFFVVKRSLGGGAYATLRE